MSAIGLHVCILDICLVLRLLANVNYMLSPVRLSSVCLSVGNDRAPYIHKAVVIFGNISTEFGTLANH